MQEALFIPAAEEPTFTVAELNASIGSVLGRAYPDEVWVQGEIANLSRPSSGHVYFDLCGEGCSISVTLWASDKQVVNAVLKRAGGAVRITDGTEVRLRGRVTWWAERGRVSVRMLSIDTAYTLGKLAEARELLLRKLALEGVLDAQQRRSLALVPLRVGVVTSDGSAAWRDLLRTLEASGVGFSVQLADARVQGAEAAASVVAALAALQAAPVPPEVICVVRGGGARTDLACFDAEAVARAIATCEIPVLTGIGHEIDTTVADAVAHLAFKTPTACAAALVERVMAFRAGLDERRALVQRKARAALDQATVRLHRASARAATSTRQHLRAESVRLDHVGQRIAARPPRLLDATSERLDERARRVAALDPARLLARGWSITRTAGGDLVRARTDAPAGTVLVTTTAGGEVRSTSLG